MTHGTVVEQASEGVSAVNARGEVLLFVEPVDWGAFEAFDVDGDVIRLLSPGSRPHVRRYGALTVGAVRGSGRVRVQEVLPGGGEGRHSLVEVRRGR